jgi:hypothetical protein
MEAQSSECGRKAAIQLERFRVGGVDGGDRVLLDQTAKSHDEFAAPRVLVDLRWPGHHGYVAIKLRCEYVEQASNP